MPENMEPAIISRKPDMGYNATNERSHEGTLHIGKTAPCSCGSESQSDSQPRYPAGTIMEPKTTREHIEVSVHKCPKALIRELERIFPEVELVGGEHALLAVPTSQHTKMDLVRVGEEVEDEKDLRLERFAELGERVRKSLAQQGYWCDYIDPCSGLPMHGENNSNVYSECDGFQLLLGYRTQKSGPCTMLLHPKWGSAVYPASMFALTPYSVLCSALESEM